MCPAKMNYVSRLPLLPLIPQVNIFKLFSQDRGKIMICFSLFPDNGDTFQFGIPLKVYKCNLKIFLHQSYLYCTLPIASSYATLLF